MASFPATTWIIAVVSATAALCRQQDPAPRRSAPILAAQAASSTAGVVLAGCMATQWWPYQSIRHTVLLFTLTLTLASLVFILLPVRTARALLHAATGNAITIGPRLAIAIRAASVIWILLLLFLSSAAVV